MAFKRFVGVLIKRLNEARHGNLGAWSVAADGHNSPTLMTNAAPSSPESTDHLYTFALDYLHFE